MNTYHHKQYSAQQMALGRPRGQDGIPLGEGRLADGERVR